MEERFQSLFHPLEPEESDAILPICDALFTINSVADSDGSDEQRYSFPSTALVRAVANTSEHLQFYRSDERTAGDHDPVPHVGIESVAYHVLVCTALTLHACMRAQHCAALTSCPPRSV